MPSRPQIVLDTNVILDWLVFGEPSVSAMALALESQDIEWILTSEMTAELACVLDRGDFKRWAPDRVRIDAQVARWGHLVPAPSAPALDAPRCSDPDDQKFIDLALASSVRWLVTRDRALLRLARAAARRGVAVLTPERWNVERSQRA